MSQNLDSSRTGYKNLMSGEVSRALLSILGAIIIMALLVLITLRG
jgi:hypothetical protein